jgi:hypothetical protein
MLYLGGERQRNRPLAPLEEVGEPPVGDDDVGEGVCGERDVGHHPFVGRFVEAELEHADGIPAVGHRREQASLLRSGFTLDRLGRERAAVRGSHQGNSLCGLPPLRASGCSATRVAEPDECVAAEVRDEERQLAGTERVGQALAQDVDGGDGRGILDGREQRAEVQPRR